MNKTKVQLFLMVLSCIITLFFTSCSKDDNSENVSPSNSYIIGTWDLTKVQFFHLNGGKWELEEEGGPELLKSAKSELLIITSDKKATITTYYADGHKFITSGNWSFNNEKLYLNLIEEDGDKCSYQSTNITPNIISVQENDGDNYYCVKWFKKIESEGGETGDDKEDEGDDPTTDNVGRVKKIIIDNETEESYTYDNKGRVITSTSKDISTGKIYKNLKFTYTSSSVKASGQYGNDNVNYEYILDSNGRVSKGNFSLGKANLPVSINYNSNNNISSITSYLDEKYGFSIDTKGNITKIASNDIKYQLAYSNYQNKTNINFLDSFLYNEAIGIEYLKEIYMSGLMGNFISYIPNYTYLNDYGDDIFKLTVKDIKVDAKGYVTSFTQIFEDDEDSNTSYKFQY